MFQNTETLNILFDLRPYIPMSTKDLLYIIEANRINIDVMESGEYAGSLATSILIEGFRCSTAAAQMELIQRN